MNVRPLLAGLAALSLGASALRPAGGPRPRVQRRRLPRPCRLPRRRSARGPRRRHARHEIAARYVATQFAALGLQPGGGGGNWYQPVEFVRFVPQGAPTLTGGGPGLHPRPRDGDAGEPRSGAAGASAPAGLRRLWARHAEARLRRLSRPRRARQDRRRAERRSRGHAERRRRPSQLREEADGGGARRGRHGQHPPAQRRGRRPGSAGFVSPIAPARPGWSRTARPSPTPARLRFSATLNDASAATLFQGARRQLSAILDEAARAGSRPRGFALAQTAQVAREPAAATRFAART